MEDYQGGNKKDKKLKKEVDLPPKYGIVKELKERQKSSELEN